MLVENMAKAWEKRAALGQEVGTRLPRNPAGGAGADQSYLDAIATGVAGPDSLDSGTWACTFNTLPAICSSTNGCTS
ncbi:hypothetical protein [Kitasatospora viridis]|uniref:Uncharacterized protein n=1 Tax=Kitasatospora viridis TaxID=281105 RepID=A0A561TWB1_9ACTN|nr:hypothetical protein [Kitasatospora viridis]TWF91399.1 hypothetical protein FHX73_12514 [Kitasatospora viridis]